MWRLTMLVLCLIAALSGTPLRQAEAADDFARSITELGHEDTIETLDGGVGDDAEVSILKAANDSPNRPTPSLAAPFAIPFTTLCFASPVLRSGSRRLADPSGLPGVRSHRWFAWLQCFLF